MISIVTIFLNAERFLTETIASVQRQTHDDWEMILVDDGSTDGSVLLARAAAAESAGRIRYVDHAEHRNLGLAASRNRGLEEARGSAILYLDSDDLLFPDALKTLSSALDPGESVAACAATLFWNWDPAFAGEPDKMQDYRAWGDRTVSGAAFLAAMTVDEGLHPANCSTLMRTGPLRVSGGFTPGVPGIYEDTAMLTALLLDQRVTVLRDCISAYRMHAASHCHTAEAQGDYSAAMANASRLRYLEWARAFVAERAPAAGALLRAIDETTARQNGGSGGLARWRRTIGNAFDRHRLVHRLHPRLAPVDRALATIAEFYGARGDVDEAARVTARRET